MILFLTNNDITKPLLNWLRQKEKVIVLKRKITKKDIIKLNPDLIISYNYKYIIPKEILKLKPKKFINLHISFLPFNRGAHPNIWSHLEKTPKGVTIHFIDESIDTGDILFQKKVTISENETLKTSYKKLHLHIQRLFKQNYSKIKKFQLKPKKQKKGTFHLAKEIKKLNIPSFNITIKKLKELNNATK